MKSRQRVLGAFDRSGYDRIPVKHEGTPELNRMLMQHFGLSNREPLLRVVGGDFRFVEPVYCGPELQTLPDGSVEGYLGDRCGLEQVLMDLVDDNPVYREIMQARFEFFYEVQRRTLEAAGGLIDVAHAGDDFADRNDDLKRLPETYP